MRKMIVLVLVLATLPVAPARAVNASTGLRVSSFRVLYGQRLSITGRVSTHLAGQSVEILAQPLGRAIARVATVESRAGGYWSYRAKPSVQTDYSAQVGGTKSRALTVGVQPAVTVSELSDGKLAVRVLGARSFTGRMVELQQPGKGGSWRTVVQEKLTSNSSAVFATTLPTSKVRIGMSVNQAGAGYLGTTSHPFLYHAYSLTIKPSSYRVLFGNPITLTGKLVGGKRGQTITIFQQQYGRSAPMRLAKVHTQEDGSWSFRTKPVIQASFHAEWSGTKISPTVKVGVQPDITVRELANGHLLAHIYGAVGFKGRQLQLQQRMPSGSWKTVIQKPIDYKSNALFTTAPASTTVRIAISVNEAGAGYLGSTSHPLQYHPGG